MRQNRAWVRFLPRSAFARSLTRTGIAAGLLLVAGCSSVGSPGGGSSGSSPVTSRTTAPSAFPLTSAAPTPTAQSSAVAAASESAAAAEACAAFADNTFIYIRTVASAASGLLTLSANPATVVCGGPDDLHYDVSGTTVTCYVVPTATISVFDLSAMSSKPIAVSKFRAYLATDRGTRTFLVTGPLTGIDALVEQYHP
jgi:hypothetical protein